MTMQDIVGSVLDVALSRDGHLVATGGDDGMIRLWGAKSGECLRALRSDRHYQRLDITGLTGATEAQRGALLALGAIERAPASSGAPAMARWSRQGAGACTAAQGWRATACPIRRPVRGTGFRVGDVELACLRGPTAVFVSALGASMSRPIWFPVTNAAT